MKKGKTFNGVYYKPVRTKTDILADPRIDRIVTDYDGYGRHMVECKEGWRFERERSIDIGNIKEMCDTINWNLEPWKP